MTKYEWFTELKRNIHRLPDDEVRRVTDYYDELFEDNIERGKTELEIIREFGNPSDVADKIMSEFDGELKDDDVTDMPPRKEKNMRSADGNDDARRATKVNGDGTAAMHADGEDVDKRNVKIAAFIVVNVVTCFAPMIIALVVWIVLAALAVAGAAIAIGGVAAAVVSFGPMFAVEFGTGFAQLGIALVLAGAGIVMAVLCVYLIKQYAKFNVYCVKSIFGKR